MSRLLEQRRAKSTLPRGLSNRRSIYLSQFRLAASMNCCLMALFLKAVRLAKLPHCAASLYFRVPNPSVSFSKIDGDRHELDMMAKRTNCTIRCQEPLAICSA
jgi:hypothetical protein